MTRDDPFRSAPLRIPEAPKAPPRPWLTPARLQHLRHAVMIEGTAVMFISMLFPIHPVRVYRSGPCGDVLQSRGDLCGHSCMSPIPRNPAAELRAGVMIALVVAFVGFLLGHAHWLLHPHPDRPDDTRWARRGAFVALMYAALGFLVTGFWAPFSVERPVLTPIFLALCAVTLITRAE